MKPALCRFEAYCGPGLPKPTMSHGSMAFVSLVTRKLAFGSCRCGFFRVAFGCGASSAAASARAGLGLRKLGVELLGTLGASDVDDDCFGVGLQRLPSGNLTWPA